MLKVLAFEARQRLIDSGSTAPPDDGKHDKELLQDFKASPGREDRFFVSRLAKMEEDGKLAGYKIAKFEDTLKFQALGKYASEHVLCASGTLAELEQKAREDFIAVCPEMKWLYPSLHNPNCFGAKVNPDACSASICATKKGPDFHGSC